MGTFRAAGEAPRHLVFKRRGALMNSAAPSSGGTGNVACGRAYQVRVEARRGVVDAVRTVRTVLRRSQDAKHPP